MNLIDMKQVEWKPDTVAAVKADVKAVAVKETAPVVAAAVAETVAETAPTTTFGKLKAFVRKAVDCCIE